jgi:hypothetical protein
MKTRTYFIVLIMLFSFQLSCQLFEPKPKSEEFYCKIDGKKFRPDNGGDMFFEPLLFDLNRDINRFDMTIMNSEHGDNNMAVLISIPTKNNILQERRYEITEEGKAYCSKGYISVGGANLNHGYEAYTGSGYIVFSKVDTLKRRVSGTFAFRPKANTQMMKLR